MACRNSESGRRKRRCSYLHEQFDLRLFFSHGCVGDQEAAVARGTGRGPGKGRRVSRPGILLQTQGCPFCATQVRSDPLVRSNTAAPRPSAAHTQLLHLGSSRLVQGAADSPAGPALDLGRGHEGWGLGDRGSGSGTKARGLPGRDEVLGRNSEGSLDSLTSPKHSTIFVPQFPRFVNEKGGHSQTEKLDTNELPTRVQKGSLRMQGFCVLFWFSFSVFQSVFWFAGAVFCVCGGGSGRRQ